jgi:hypothetical protein
VREGLPSGGLQRSVDGLPSQQAKQVAAVLAGSPVVEIEPGVPYFRASFSNAALLIVEDGSVVLRATFPDVSRSVVTCEAATGGLLLPPSPEAALFGLGRSRQALALGLKVDAQAIPGDLAAAIRAGNVNLDDPAAPYSC